MINIKITVPVWKKYEFGRFDRTADVAIAADFDSFSEGYEFLRAQVDKLLREHQADNTLWLNHEELRKEIANKERTLELTKSELEVAKKQLVRLQNFLQRLGIDPSAYSLLIANSPIKSSTSIDAEVEVVDPIPFDLLDEGDEKDSGGEF
jgi:hypothetical protein